MAAVSLSPVPHSLSAMSGRRAPLASNPNAVNSPYRAVTSAAAAKQKRSHAAAHREDSYTGQPPAKKQMLDSQSRSPSRQQPSQASAEGRVFTRKSNAPTAFERSCVAASQKSAQQTMAKKAEKPADKVKDPIKEWQKHIRGSFPRYVFYFESVSEDYRQKCTKQVTALGAREEKFFSNAVTHVVTTRAIPPEQPHPSAPSAASAVPPQQNGQPRTINPSLLERSTGSASAQTDLLSTKGKFTFEASLNKRLVPHVQDGEVRRTQARNADVLYRARELGMKIWTLEKLQRMMNTMFETDSGHQGNGYTTGSNATLSRTNRDADLSQLLRNERLNGPSDRDPTVVTKEMIMFKGPFIYIHDIDEKQRPIMVREYPKVAHKEDGDWPQFRSVANGKCPFVEDVDHNKREAEKEREMLRLQRQQEKEKSMIPKARGSTAAQAPRMQPPTVAAAKRPLVELDDGSNRNITVLTKQTNPFDTGSRTRVSAEPSSRGPQNAFISRAGTGTGRLFGGEPVASGVQASNVTSAIRSQMISSTAAQPGAKAGTSKEVHGLQRKVLERTSGGPASYGGVASSHRTTDVSQATRDEMAARQAKRKEKLDLIEEDADPSERDEHARKAENARKARAVQQRKLERRDPKPGYCENCQDKFEDFDEHIQSRKHRKFAEKLDNWLELDALLDQLARPLREDMREYLGGEHLDLF